MSNNFGTNDDDTDIKSWMQQNKIWNEILYNKLIKKNLTTTNDLTNLMQEQLDEILVQTRIECISTLHLHSQDDKKKKKIEKKLVKFEKTVTKLKLQLQPKLPVLKLDINNRNDFKTNYSDHDAYISKIRSLEKENSKLKADLAIAYQNILDMSNVVNLNQKFPTIQETLGIYRGIRDQQYHNTMKCFRKYYRDKYKNNKIKYSKYYINQIIHEIMYNTLIKTYSIVRLYKYNMFNNIATELNIINTIKQTHLNSNNVFIQKEINKIISSRFGTYFKTNYKYILKVDAVCDDIIEFMINNNRKFLNDINPDGNVYKNYIKYIRECCQICWIMIIHNPHLTLYPLKWEEDNDNNKVYDENIHKRMLGSDRNSRLILYYVWPIIHRNDLPVNDQKMEVILKNEMYLS